MKKLKQKYKKWWYEQEDLPCKEGKHCVGCSYDWELDYHRYVEGFLEEIRKSARL